MSGPPNPAGAVIHAQRPQQPSEMQHERDTWQVLANGGAAAASAIMPILPEAVLWMVTASLVAAAADTWATSFGGWSRTDPRHILRSQPVPPGTSGGVTLLGSAGALAGAASVGAAHGTQAA